MESQLKYPEEKDEETQIVPLLQTCYREFCSHWWWFVLSVVLCLGIGTYYLMRQARVYQRQSVMLIEDSNGSSSSGGSSSRLSRNRGMNTLLELNGVSVGDNLKNEIFILTSERLMKRVVERLHLDVDYTTKENLHTIALYGNERPFEVLFQRPAKGKKGVSFTVKKTGENTCVITGLTDSKGNKLPDVQATLGQMVNTPAGPLSIVRSRAFNLWKDQEIQVTRMPLDVAARAYAGSITAEEYDKESSLIVLTCSNINADRATDMLNTLFDVYKEDVVDNKNHVAENTAKFIDNRIALIGGELSNVEDRLADFKRRNQIVDYESAAKAMADQTLDAREQSLQIETQLNVARYLSDYINNHANDHDLIPALSIGDASFNTQVQQYNEVMNQRNRAVGNSSEQVAIVREFDRQLAQMRQTVAASIHNYIASLQLRLKDAQANESVISGKIASAPEQEKQGIDIKRQQSLKESLYNYLLQKREEVALQQAVSEANVRLVEGPLGSDHPVSPRARIILLISLAIGVLIPSAIIWLIRTLDVSIHNRSEVEKATDIPVLGEIPHLKTAKDNADISTISSDAPIVEAFRLLRFSLGFMRSKSQVIMTTSTTPAQGKTFVTRNLAYILAMAGKKVVVVDADIRKRTLSKGLHAHIGLSTYLTDELIHVDEAIRHDALGNGIDLVPAGPMPPNPAEILMSERLETLIAELRQRYDHIIIDTTPFFAVADANIVNRVADTTLYVIRLGMQKREVLPILETMYEEKRIKNICFVLNDADGNIARYNNGYGYGYGRIAPSRTERAKKIVSRLWH